MTKLLIIVGLVGALAQGISAGQSEPPLLIDSAVPLDAGN